MCNIRFLSLVMIKSMQLINDVYLLRLLGRVNTLHTLALSKPCRLRGSLLHGLSDPSSGPDPTN